MSTSTSLSPVRYNFTIYQGATFYQRILFEIDGQIQDLSGYTATLEIKDRREGFKLLTLDNNMNGGIILGEAEGAIDIVITADQTEDLTWTRAIYELLVTNPTPRTDILLRGGFKVIAF